MKSTASCFKSIFVSPLISKPLIVEDFRRYWLIPAIGWFAYFISAVFPILMSYRNLEHENGMARYILSLLQSQTPFVFFFNVMLPLVVAATLYRYMHSVSSAAVVHAMPFNRNTLFNSHLVSGYCMSILPVLLNGVILLLISKPLLLDPQTGNLMSVAAYTSDGAMMAQNVFARGDILSWMWQSALIIAVIYAIAAFTASVTGNSIVHFVLSGIFIGLAPGFLGILIAYFSHFLYGYVTADSYTNFILGINPIMQPFRNAETHFTAGWIIWYLASILVMYLLGLYLYRTKKLERATESITFRPLAIYMSYIASFFGMTAFGFYLYTMGQNNPLYLYLGFAAGTILVYLVAELIIAKSWNIFNKKTFARLGAYFLIATAFLLGLNFDITGYEKRIPSTSNISSVYLDESAFSYVLHNGYYGNSDRENRMTLKTKENINAVLRLHEAMITRRGLPPTGHPQLGSYAATSMYFDYSLTNASFLTRQYYNLPMQEFVVDNADLKTIMESDEFKSQSHLYSFYPKDGQAPEGLRITPRRFDKIDINSNYGPGTTLSDPSELASFHDCMKADLMERRFEEMVMPSAPFIDVNYRMLPDREGSLTSTDAYYSSQYGVYHQDNESSYSFIIDGSFKSTMNWLKENGHYDSFVLDPSYIRYITIDKIIFDENGYPIQTGDPERDQQLKMEEMHRSGIPVVVEDKYTSESITTISETPPEATATKMVITDSVDILKVMSTYNNMNSPVSPLMAYTVRIFAAIPDTAPDSEVRMNIYTGCYFDMTIPAKFAAYFK